MYNNNTSNYFDALLYYIIIVIGPWEHIMMAGVGGFVGYNYYKWEDQMLTLVNEQRTIRNMPSIKRDDIMKTPIILGKKNV